MSHLPSSLLAALAFLVASALTGPARAEPALTRIARFDQQVTGIAVAKDGRMFVNFPRWEKDVPVSVAEVMKDGALKPFPDAGWNAWSNLKPLSTGDHWVCVQSVTVDPQGFLWVVDPAAPGNEFIKPGGPKLVKIDLATNKIVKIVHFDTAVAPQGSYMNDVRVSPDGKHAYLTDSGQKGALIVVDVGTGQSRRVLEGDPKTQPEPNLVPVIDGHELRRPDNRAPAFAADGVTLTPDGKYLIWQALIGKTLYRIPTSALDDAALADNQLSRRIEKLAPSDIADGLWMDGKGYLYVTDPQHNAVRMRSPDGKTTTIARDDRLRWPDSLAEGADGAIYVTASHIEDMAQFHDKGTTQQGPWELFRIERPHP